MQSGFATCPDYLRMYPGIKYSKKFAVLFDCPISNATVMIECLRRVPAEEFVKQFYTPTDEFVGSIILTCTNVIMIHY
jgi:hypothetical protein